ncbi:MAG TPA: response regulator transcription factor [Pyrinomonadaceae bacterium]|jgi:Response regulators consisting of a CheY-like receiver domain and a winged-helix DNA-binding domain|nr:response regulator transcription factor [Pyrinomonadaceae bacterium]
MNRILPNTKPDESKSNGRLETGTALKSEVSNKRTRILIVEDEPAMVQGLRDNFEYEGYEVISALDGSAGLEMALNGNPDLVVLDVMMPKMSGLDVCKHLKVKKPNLPIIMLTARGQEIDKVVGLELGADDYVTKPFSIRELMARVKAVLRRVNPQPDVDVYKFSDVEVNVKANEVLRGGRAVELSAKEFALLAYFVAHPGETLSRDRLLDAVWGYENYPNTRTVDAHIVHLRQKLETNPEEPRFILTVHGSGYKFVG